MNFSIIDIQNDAAKMSWDAPTDISTNIYLSLNVIKGTIFNRPKFGLDLSDIKKITNSNIDLIKQRIETALAWLINVGKAKTVTVILERDLQDLCRLNIKVEVVQANNEIITYSQWRSVGGPSTSFVYP